MPKPDLEAELDRLHALPLSEFIGARNELAKRLRAAGDREAADEVKALAKPSVTAWAVNALFHHQRTRFDELVEAAADVRAALAGGGDRRKADAARRKALQELLRRAARLLGEAGHAATPANRQRISHTLEALAARDPAEPGPKAGRLTGDLEPQGFDVLAGLAASLAPPSPAAGSRRAPAKTSGRKKQAPAARDEAGDRRLEEARREVEERQEALDELARELETAEADAAEANERRQRLVEAAAEAERRASEAAAEAGEAKQQAAAAKAALTKARTAHRKRLSRLTAARRRLERYESQPVRNAG